MYQARKSNIFHFFTIVLMIIGSFAAAPILDKLQKDAPLLPIIFPQLFLIFGPIVIYFILKKGFLKHSILGGFPGAVNLFMAFLLTYLLLPTVGLLNAISMTFAQNHISGVIDNVLTLPLLPSLIAIAVFPALFEELSTRFILLNHYRHKSYLVAIFMSGLIFGMIHLNINQFMYALVLGAVFAFVVLITGSFWTGVFMHFVLNANSLILNYFMSEQPQNALTSTEVITAADIYAIAGVNLITIPLSTLVILFLIHYNGKKSILRQKPTVLELATGRKFYRFSEEEAATLPWVFNEKGTPTHVEEDYFSQYEKTEVSFFSENKDRQPSRESVDIYLAQQDRPDNWALLAMILLFLAISFLLEN